MDTVFMFLFLFIWVVGGGAKHAISETGARVGSGTLILSQVNQPCASKPGKSYVSFSYFIYREVENEATNTKNKY